LPVAEGALKKILARLIKILIVFLSLAVFNSFLQIFVIFRCQEIKKYQSKISLLEKDISRVRVEIASLESFDRIQTIALNELGMRSPGPDDYHWVEALPVASENTPGREADSQRMAKADLWGNLYQLVGNIGKTMAQSL